MIAWNQKFLIVFLISWFALMCTGGYSADTIVSDEHVFQTIVKPFVEAHCYKCHDARKAAAGFRIDELGSDFSAGRTADQWREVIDMINLGDMPPKEEPRLDADAAYPVVEWVGRSLKRAEREARMAGGKNVMRRLNRYEFAYTVGDLFRFDRNLVEKLITGIPADGKAEGFDRMSSALFLDQTQLIKYMEIAAEISKQAIQSEPPEAGTYVWIPDRKPDKEMVSIQVGGLKGDHLIPNGESFFEVRGKGFVAWCGNPNSKKEEVYGSKIPPGPMPNLDAIVRLDGYYRVRVHGGAFVGKRGEPIGLHFRYGKGTPIESTFLMDIVGTLDEPGVAETVVYLRTGNADQKKSLEMHWNGLNNVRIKNPSLAPLMLKRTQLTQRKQKAIAARDELEATKLGKELETVLEQLESFEGPEWVHNDKHDLTEVPRLYVEKIVVEGPITQAWPPPSHRMMEIEDRLPSADEEIEKFFTNLLPHAYRRPVADIEVDEMTRVVRVAREEHGLSAIDALRTGLQAMLCSPEFLYLDNENPVDGYALANRMSYFLWRSMPDDELNAYAMNGRLKDPSILKTQIDRMLADPKSRRFVEGFAGQWLSVELYGSVMPAEEYRDYDEDLEAASKEEPLSFFQYVLDNNLPITNFVDSDFVVINERLARHYKIDWPGVVHSATNEKAIPTHLPSSQSARSSASGQQNEFRALVIRPEDHRGGVFGMAGLLTLLADGSRTLPVRRAAWVLENLLNDPPAPPPPNAGEIQPNTSGPKLTVRERLALHRDEPTCASCHAKLDGYGLALENYDAIGAWRDKANGEGFRENKAPLIDASGILKSGKAFNNLQEFKSALVDEKEKLGRAFTEKLLTYALGRPLGYVDRKTVDELTEELSRNGYRIQALIHAIIASPAFQTK